MEELKPQTYQWTGNVNSPSLDFVICDLELKIQTSKAIVRMKLDNE